MVNNLDCFQGNVGHSLLEARVRVQLNLQKAAEAVLISPEQLQAIEEGSLTPSVDTVVALAKVYQAPVENFLAPLYINFYKSTQEYQAQKQAQQEILKPKLDNNEDLTVKEQDLQALPEITMRKEYFCEDFPEKLKRIRQNAGLSVKDLAHALQLSSTLILSWEEGRLLPTTFKQVVQITQELKATLLDFIKAEAFPNAVVNPKKSYNVLYIKARKEHSKFLRTLPQVSLNQKLWLWSIPEDIFSNIPVNIALEIKVYACFGDFIKKGGSIALPPEIIYQMIGTDAKLASSLQTEIEAYRAQILAERSSSKALSVKAQTKAQSLEVSKQCLTSQEQNLALNPTKLRYSASRVITEYLRKDFAEYIKRVRKSLKLTQNDIALKIGSSQVLVHYMEKKQKVPLSVKMLENLAIALNLKPQDLLKTGLLLDDLKHDLREHKIPVKLLSSQEDLQDQTLLFDENNQDQAQMVLRYLKKVGLEKYLQDLQSYFQALQSRFRANSFKADLSHKPCPTVLDDQDFAKINENLQKLEQILTYKQILALVGKA